MKCSQMHGSSSHVAICEHNQPYSPLAEESKNSPSLGTSESTSGLL